MPALDAGIFFPATKKMAVSSTAMMRCSVWSDKESSPVASDVIQLSIIGGQYFSVEESGAPLPG
jgi:hypothetical protein